MQNLLSSKQRELIVTGWYSKLLSTPSLMKHTQFVLPPRTEVGTRQHQWAGQANAPSHCNYINNANTALEKSHT